MRATRVDGNLSSKLCFSVPRLLLSDAAESPYPLALEKWPTFLLFTYNLNNQMGILHSGANLLETGYTSSALLPRLADAIFFYLDANAVPVGTAHLEPSKVTFWTRAWFGNTATF